MKKKKLDSYYKQALAVAELSPDEQTKVGALLIKKDGGAIVGNSYNGFIRGGPDLILPKIRPEKYIYIIHAETNLMYNSCREGMVTKGCFVFCTLSPCINCCRAMWQSGIDMVIFKDKYRDFDTQMEMKDLKLDIEMSGEYHIMKISPKECF